MLTTLNTILAVFFCLPNGPSPEITLKSDDTVVRQSCRIIIPKDQIIPDTNRDGVIHVEASDITIEFADDAIFRGSPANAIPDTYDGYAIRINNQKNVTIRHTKISGYRSAIYATNADNLTLEDIDASLCRRSRLYSTTLAEDATDWLHPHENDKNEWLTSYGAALYVEDSKDITVRRCRAHNGQNGLILDRVTGAKIYDNDFSFLSGWGIALWRSDRNTITRNACDFCVRGYSHGVYNRGEDSAGILAFEQCSNNIIAENSATHCGDGFFAFAGREALGEAPAPSQDFDYKRRGCNDNLIVGNDFSYAAAHGLEITFSFGNRIFSNKLIGNAICGIWGGYSQDTTITDNDFRENGDAGYGLERGGIDIEHGKNNKIIRNRFQKNKCGIHLWWDDDTDTLKTPWAKANTPDSTGNLIAANALYEGDVGIHLRGKSQTTIGSNTMVKLKTTVQIESEAAVIRDSEVKIDAPAKFDYAALGDTRPIGARKEIDGLENIILTEWGPWDHHKPLIRLTETGRNTHVYQFLKLPGRTTVSLMGNGLTGRMLPEQHDCTPYLLSAKHYGVYPYTLVVTGGDFKQTIRDTLFASSWETTFFPWTVDPRKDFDGWLIEASNPASVKCLVPELTFKFGNGGPTEAKLCGELKNSKIGTDHFGVIAKCRVKMPKGKWKFTTLSDDGVRLVVEGKTIIDNWTWHTPTRDEGIFESTQTKAVDITLYYFELDGYATLSLSLSRLE